MSIYYADVYYLCLPIGEAAQLGETQAVYQGRSRIRDRRRSLPSNVSNLWLSRKYPYLGHSISQGHRPSQVFRKEITAAWRSCLNIYNVAASERPNPH